MQLKTLLRKPRTVRGTAVCAAVVLTAGLATMANDHWPAGASSRQRALNRFLSALEHRDFGRLRAAAPTSADRRMEWARRYGGIPVSAVDVTLYPKAFDDQPYWNAVLVFHLAGGRTAQADIGQYHDLRGWFVFIYPPYGPCPPDATSCGWEDTRSAEPPAMPIP